MSATTTNPALSVALGRYGHLPLRTLRYTTTPGQELVHLAFLACQDYEAACAIAGKAPDPGRMIGTHRSGDQRRVRDTVSHDGVVLEHLCWPHLDCWGRGGAA